MVKRFDLLEGYSESGCTCRMDEREDGDYVLNSDYAALERENSKLREEIDILMGQLKERCNRIVEVNEENYDLRQRIAKLEAPNA